jgi:hypothetical protein
VARIAGWASWSHDCCEYPRHDRHQPESHDRARCIGDRAGLRDGRRNLCRRSSVHGRCLRESWSHDLRRPVTTARRGRAGLHNEHGVRLFAVALAVVSGCSFMFVKAPSTTPRATARLHAELCGTGR